MRSGSSFKRLSKSRISPTLNRPPANARSWPIAALTLGSGNVSNRGNPVTCLVGKSLLSSDRFVAMSSGDPTSALSSKAVSQLTNDNSALTLPSTIKRVNSDKNGSFRSHFCVPFCHMHYRQPRAVLGINQAFTSPFASAPVARSLRQHRPSAAVPTVALGSAKRAVPA